MSNKGKIYTRKIIAQILELSEKRVKQLTEEGVIEEFSAGNYKLLPTVQGYIRYLQAQVADDDTSSNYSVEKAKLTRLKREDAELDLQLKRNDLHRSVDVEFVVTNMIVAFKAKLETMPYKIVPSLISLPPGKDPVEHMTEALKDAVEEALNELSGYDAMAYAEDGYADPDDVTLGEA